MRNTGIIIFMLILSFSASCQTSQNNEQEPYKGDQPMYLVNVSGMSCMGCVATVTKTISEQDGVEWVQVDLEKREASFAANPEKTDMAALAAAMEKAGYEITEPKRKE